MSADTIANAAGESSFDTLIESIRRLAGDGSSEGIWACADLLRAMDARGAFRQILNAEIRDMPRAARPVPRRLVPLVYDANFTLSVLTVRKRSTSGHAAPTSAEAVRDHAEAGILYVLGPSAVTFMVAEQPDVREHEVFDPSKRIGPARPQTVAPGGTLNIVPGRTIVADMSSKSDTVVLCLCGTAQYPISWAYDARSGTPVRPHSASMHVTRLEYALAVLSELGGSDRERSVALVTALLEHPTYFIRWRAVHALNALSPEKAFESLKRLASTDPHPHVRDAARRTLEPAAGEVA